MVECRVEFDLLCLAVIVDLHARGLKLALKCEHSATNNRQSRFLPILESCRPTLPSPNNKPR